MSKVTAAKDSAPAPGTDRLKVTEVFCSLQGEARSSGAPTAFIRLTGCPLRCVYCDTEYAFHGGQWRSIPSLLDEVRDLRVQHVCVTGGEPLAQERCLKLLAELCDQGFQVSLETSGALDISRVDPRVVRVVDIKTPGSGEAGRNLWSNLAELRNTDAVKFVLRNRKDYEWTMGLVRDRLGECPCPVFFSPSAGELDPADLAGWMVEDRSPARLQIQLHKLLWGDEPGR